MKRNLKSVIAVATLVTTVAATASIYTVEQLTMRPAQPALRPVSNDSVDTKGKKFDVKSMLAQRTDFDFSRGTKETLNINGDSLFLFAKPTNGDVIYTAQTIIRPDGFFKGDLKVSCTSPFSIFIDGKEKATKTSQQDTLGKSSLKNVTLNIEPQTATAVTIRILASDTATAPRLKINVTPDKKSENVNLQISPLLKKRFMLANTDQGEKAASTAVSPDGKYTAIRYFKRLEDQKTQWRYEIIGNQTGNIVARPTNFSGWMPKGCAYYYTRKTDDGFNLYKVEIPAGTESLVAEAIPEGSFHWSPDESYIVYYSVSEPDKETKPLRRYASPDDRIKGNRRRSSLKMYSLATGSEQVLTFGTKSAQLLDISPDSKNILFMVTKETPSKYPFYASTIVQLKLDGMKADTIIADGLHLGGASYSPDGKNLMIFGSPRAFGNVGLNAGNHPIPNDYDTQIYIYDISTGNVTAPLKTFDPSVSTAEWSKADGKIYILVNEGFCKSLYKLDPVNGKIISIPTEAQNVSNFSIGDRENTYLSYTGQGDDYAGRAWLLNMRTNKTRLIANPFDKTLSKIELGTTTSWTFTAKDGTLIEGTMTTPPDFDPNKKYPLLVYYYGGTSPSQHGLTHPYVPQLYASRGYVVYVLNPSGTYGYGQEFSARHVNAWGKQTAEDIIEGVKLFCKAHPFVNDKKIGCFGASYGGFMTQYLLTQTDIFAAAMSHAGISNVTSYWGEGYWGYTYNSVAAAESYPWTDPELFTKQGSLFNADKIHTPLLLIHGTADTNVPIGESIQLFNALSILGRQVEFISVDGGDHTSGSFSYDKRLLWHRTVMAWFARWLQDDPRWWNEMYPDPNL